MTLAPARLIVSSAINNNSNDQAGCTLVELTTEEGTVISDLTSSQLRAALDKLGARGNSYAILAAAPEKYIQVAGNDAEGFVAEYARKSTTVLRTGDYVQVVYDPTDPAPASTARIATFNQVWGRSFVMLFIGILGAAVVTFVWLVFFRGRHTAVA